MTIFCVASLQIFPISALLALQLCGIYPFQQSACVPSQIWLIWLIPHWLSLLYDVESEHRIQKCNGIRGLQCLWCHQLQRQGKYGFRPTLCIPDCFTVKIYCAFIQQNVFCQVKSFCLNIKKSLLCRPYSPQGSVHGL